MESDKHYRPLDKIRELKGAKKFAFNSLMIIITLLYGGCRYVRACQDQDEYCSLWWVVTFHGNISQWLGYYVSTMCLFILALTSKNAKHILESTPLQFLGRVSFMLYLFHVTVLHGIEDHMRTFLLWLEFSEGFMLTVTITIGTFILLVSSHLLEKYIDRPAKNFAHQVDFISRMKRPPVPKTLLDTGVSEDEYYSFKSLVLRSKAIVRMVQWLVFVGIVIAIKNIYISIFIN